MSAESNSTITWLLVIAGWVSTHYFTLRREKRKEVRANLDSIKSQLSELEKESTVFHTSENYSPEKARAITLQIQRISREIELETKIKENTSRLRWDLRKSITLLNFDPSTFKQLTHDSDLLEKAASAHDKLISQLEYNYIRFYRDTYF